MNAKWEQVLLAFLLPGSGALSVSWPGSGAWGTRRCGIGDEVARMSRFATPALSRRTFLHALGAAGGAGGRAGALRLGAGARQGRLKGEAQSRPRTSA